MPTPNGGTAVSISHTPQAKDDVAAAGEDHVLTIDVMANDLGGAAKHLYSVDQANPLNAATSAVSQLGAAISIVNGQIVYDPTSTGAIQALAQGETATDTFSYVIQLGNGTLSVATVTVTVTGANDAPVLSADVTHLHALTELADTTGATSPDTASATLAFHDVDLSDTHTVSIGAAQATWSAGTVPTSTATALNAALTGAVTDSTHSGTGSIALAFSAADKAFDFLAAGETLTVTYDVTVKDNNGATSTQPVTFQITGTNDAPVVAADTGVHAFGETAGATGDTTAHTLTGSLAFTDPDLSDTHTVSVGAPTAVWSNGTTPAGAISALNGALTPTLADATHTGAGSVGLAFSAADNAFDFLAQGETLTVTYDVSVTDSHGVTSTQPVTLTITGSNDGPVLNADAAPGHALSEAAGQTGSGAADTASAALTFTDVDLSDTHGVSIGAAQASWSGGAVPGATLTALNGALSSALTDSTHSGAGSIALTFSAADQAFDFLAAGETMTVTYDVTVTDNHGAASTQAVSFTVTGANDAPVLAVVDPNFPVSEHPNSTGDNSVSQDGATTLTFTDVDLSDHHTVSVGAPSLVWSAGAGLPAGLASTLTGALTTSLSPIGALQAHDSTGTGQGVILASFAAPDAAFDFLAAGETLKVTYNVTVDDGHGGTATQPVTVTITGANDTPVVTSAVSTGAVTEDATPTGTETASGTIAFSDADLTDHHTVSSVLASTTASHAYGTLTPVMTTDGNGAGVVTWTYSVNDAGLQSLGAGETVTETYNVTVDDGHGGTVAQPVVITLTGTNDAPILAAQPAASNLLVNGDFDHGNTGVNVPVQGWTNTAGGVEVLGAGTYGVSGATGNVMELDVNGGSHDDVSQTVATTAGEAYTFSFDVAQRAGFPGVTNRFEVVWNGQVIDTITPASTAMEHHSYTVVSAGGVGKVEFVEAGPDDGVGTILDNVSLTAAGIQEQPGVTGSSALDAYATTLTFTDVDLHDVHTASAALQSLVVSGGGSAPAGLATALSGALATSVSEANGAGAVAANFHAADSLFDFLQAGQTLTVTYDVTVSDGHGGTSMQPVTFTVAGTDDAPVVSQAIPDQQATMLQAFNFTPSSSTFSDADNASLTWSATKADGSALPTWLHFDPTTHAFTGTPAGADVGGLDLKVSASDGTLSTSDTFHLTVNILNQTLNGTANGDQLTGDVGADTITGNGGNDTLVGGAGNDVIYGDATGTQGPAPTASFVLSAVAQSDLTHGNTLVTPAAGTTINVAPGDDNSSSVIDITSVFGSQGLNFFGNHFTSLFVNTNGNLTFGNSLSSYTPTSIAAGSIPIIAPFWADVMTNFSGGGTVSYNLDAADGVFTATWDHVGYYYDHSNPTDTFQVQLINEGSGNFDIIFRYQQIGWTTGDASGGSGGLGGSVARAGFNSGTGTEYEIPESANQTQMLGLPGESNVGIPGVFEFQVRNGVVTASNSDYIDGGAGQDTLTGGSGADTFVFHVGEANGDVVTDFNPGDGDKLLFVGYGAGATFTEVDATHWQLNYGAGQHEVITFQNAPPIQAQDYSWTGVFTI